MANQAAGEQAPPASPAGLGADQVTRRRILLSQADVTDIEEHFVLDAIRSGWVAPLGPHVDAFEAEIADRVGVAGALALTSGTAALHLALLHAGARPGTVVVLPTMTFAASANAVVYTGADPVFVDAQLSDGNVDPGLLVDAVDTLLTEGRTVAAVMTVDLFGRCADYLSISPAMEERGIAVIEDAAEALGAGRGSRAAGAFGLAAALSFNGNKIMTTSGGGMLLSDDLELLARARYLSTQARQPVAWYEHTDIGFNYRMSNILAALGRAQLTRLDGFIARRRAVRDRYVEALSDLGCLRFLGRDTAIGDVEDNCWLTTAVLDPKVTSISADLLIKVLADEGVEARHLWKPLHAQPIFATARSFVTGVSEHLFDTGVALPSGSSLSDDDVDIVIATLRSTLSGT